MNGPIIERTENMLLNGDFSQGGTHWASVGVPPARVWYENGHCATTLGAYAEQTVNVQSNATYRLSLKAQKLYGGEGEVRLTSKGKVKPLQLFPNTPSEHVMEFTTPIDATELTVRIIGHSGEILFDDVQLILIQAESDELIPNGDFSEAGRHWGIENVPPGDVSFLGNQLLATNGAYAHQTITVDPVTEYRFSLNSWVYSGRGTAQVIMQPGGHTETINLMVNTGWDYYELVFNSPNGTHAVQVKLTGITGNVRFDNVSFKRI